MRIQKKLIAISAITGCIIISTSAIRPGKMVNGEYKNLKVLPANISSKELSQIMVDEFQDDLGVSCNYCHAENKDSHKPDYASDEKPEKEIARAMMRMTIGINKKYFSVKHPFIGDSVLVITCVSCHHGQPHPDNVSVRKNRKNGKEICTKGISNSWVSYASNYCVSKRCNGK